MVRCASLKNIVVLFAWSASHFSLFFHLSITPSSATGSGVLLRPTALHPVSYSHIHKTAVTLYNSHGGFVNQLRINNINRITVYKCFNILSEHINKTFSGFKPCPCNMRSDQAVFRLKKRIVGRRRFG